MNYELILATFILVYINLTFFTCGLMVGLRKYLESIGKKDTSLGMLHCLLWPYLLYKYIIFHMEMKRRIEFVKDCEFITRKVSDIDRVINSNNLK